MEALFEFLPTCPASHPDDGKLFNDGDTFLSPPAACALAYQNMLSPSFRLQHTRQRYEDSTASFSGVPRLLVTLHFETLPFA